MQKLLPIGYVEKIATDTGYTKTYIYKWFKTDFVNIKIENSVMRYLAEVLEEQKILRERLKNALCEK